MKTKIKICGITHIEDTREAISAGADALGFVFYPPSKRNLAPQKAREIITQLPPFISVVGLFVDPTADFVQEVLQTAPLDQLQFHGHETNDFCAQFGRRWLKAVPMNDLSSPAEAENYVQQFPDAAAFLFDAFGREKMGGSGTQFNWANLPQTKKPIIIAGGLNPDNIADVVRRFRPFAVDVSSGVESTPARKSSAKMRSFIKAIENAE